MLERIRTLLHCNLMNNISSNIAKLLPPFCKAADLLSD